MTIPMLYPDNALSELERASRLPGRRGMYLGTNIGGKHLDDPEFVIKQIGSGRSIVGSDYWFTMRTIARCSFWTKLTCQPHSGA